MQIEPYPHFAMVALSCAWVLELSLSAAWTTPGSSPDSTFPPLTIPSIGSDLPSLIVATDIL